MDKEPTADDVLKKFYESDGKEEPAKEVAVEEQELKMERKVVFTSRISARELYSLVGAARSFANSLEVIGTSGHMKRASELRYLASKLDRAWVAAEDMDPTELVQFSFEITRQVEVQQDAGQGEVDSEGGQDTTN